MKIKVIISICLVAAVALLSAAYMYFNNIYNNESINNSDSNIHSVKAGLSEMRVTQEQLIKSSDLIVRCKFYKKITKDIKRNIINEDGSVSAVTEPATTYKLKVLEALKGTANKYIEVATAAGGNEQLETGDEFVLFLEYKEQYDVYILVSLGQGLNIVRYEKDNSKGIKNSNSENEAIPPDASLSVDEPVEIRSAETKEVMVYKQLKEKIKELDKK
jgi:Na+-transporting NADH:ubiquinone oxidoreductase subunit NqrC